MNTKNQKEAQTKLTKGLLDMIILQRLQREGMHGYELITGIRKDFGVYFGPSTIYPLLGLMEKKGVVQSTWNMNTERPRKVYTLTEEGRSVLAFTETSLMMIRQKISIEHAVDTQTPTLTITQ